MNGEFGNLGGQHVVELVAGDVVRAGEKFVREEGVELYEFGFHGRSLRTFNVVRSDSRDIPVSHVAAAKP